MGNRTVSGLRSPVSAGIRNYTIAMKVTRQVPVASFAVKEEIIVSACKKRAKNGNGSLFDQGALPFDPAVLSQVLGKIIRVEYLCPGVYFITALNKAVPLELGVDYYIVLKNSPAISATGKAYGKEVANHPELLSYRYEDERSGQFVVEYEAYKFMTNNHMPLPEGETLCETALYGTELNPEYFGTYPVPVMTPWGYTLRHKTVGNGIYWMETEECCWILGVHDLLTNDLSDKTQKRGKRLDYGQENDADSFGYLFFDLESSCLALYELVYLHNEWLDVINRTALENTICLNHPDYAEAHNQQQLRSFGKVGIDNVWGTNHSPELISFTKGAGTEFFQFD